MPRLSRALARLAGGCLLALAPVSATYGQETALSVEMVPAPQADAAFTYADLVDLALPARVAARAQVRKAVRLDPEEAPGLAPGWARLYIEARTTALLIGPNLGESIRFLADVPLNTKGKVPKLTKTDVLVLGQTVQDRPGELQLVAPDAMLAATSTREMRLRAILTELAQPDALPAITALREALHVPGNLADEGETQLFLATASGAPVSISVLRRPGQPVTWGVSFTEIVDSAARPPLPETLAWYRLACALPPRLPDRANISRNALNKRIAAEDYARVLADLGTCARLRPRS
jgi:hypothetical protein